MEKAVYYSQCNNHLGHLFCKQCNQITTTVQNHWILQVLNIIKNKSWNVSSTFVVKLIKSLNFATWQQNSRGSTSSYIWLTEAVGVPQHTQHLTENSSCTTLQCVCVIKSYEKQDAALILFISYILCSPVPSFLFLLWVWVFDDGFDLCCQNICEVNASLIDLKDYIHATIDRSFILVAKLIKLLTS